MKRKGAYIVLFILFFSLINSVSAVWIYPNVDMAANNFTLNTITAQNYTSVTYDDTWINLSEGGNITFAGKCSSSRSLIEQNGLCGIGNYTTDISIDVYAPADWTVGSASVTCISNNSEADTPVTTYSTSTVNSTHKRLTFTYNPSNDFDIIDMGFFDANVSVSVSNDTLRYSGYNLTEDLFEVYHLASVGNITSSYNSTYDSINMSWNSVTHNTTTFRPNASGSKTECTPNGAANNWECVNESTSDEDGTYNSITSISKKHDTFNIPDHTTETGTITGVTVYIRGKTTDNPAIAGMWVYIKIGGNYYEKLGLITINYKTYSYTWTSNPSTDVAWTWTDIDNLEIGYSMYAAEGEARLTQCYTIVDWDDYTQGAIDEADSFVVVRSNTSQPVCPTDGYEVQNSTSIYYNVSRTFTETYFTVFTYNSTTNSYGTGVSMLWGGIQLQCFNESNPSQAIDFDIEITNSDASEVYTASDVSNGQAISFDDIPYGDDTVFVISNSSYHQRIYYYDLVVNHFYNYSFYLPPTETGPSGNTTDTQLYYIQVINEYDQPVEDVLVNIKKYINTTDTYLNVSVLITDGNGYVSLYLIPDEHYKLFLTKTGYEAEISEFFPDPDFYGIYYPKVVKIYFEEEELPPGYIESENIFFEGYIDRTSQTLYLNYTDLMEQTINTHIYIYEYNYTTKNETLLNSDSKTNNSLFQVTVANINNSNRYIVVLWYNHTTFGTQKRTLVFEKQITTTTTQGRGDALFEANYGINPFGWTNTIMWLLVIVLYFSGSERELGFYMIVMGVVMIFINSYIGFNTTLSIAAGGILPILHMIVGIMVLWRDANKRRMSA